jgi:polyhydroxybutyrate depolymerase
MAFALSCRLAGRLAAVGTVSAAQDQPWDWCRATAPVPFIDFHGTRDPLVPYLGGRSWSAPRPFPAVTAWTASWARRNGCQDTPVVDTVAPDAIRTRYEGCASPAILYTILGGGHAWPGGKPLLPWILGHTSRDVSATSLMWDFFKAHPLADR